MKIIVPPIKCQGIKTKLIPWIKEKISSFEDKGVWYEPFMGSAVVGFNIRPQCAVFGDNNPHLIRFYNDVKCGDINHLNVRQYLEIESRKLSDGADDYYKEVRQRFNERPNSLDFLFLNRACFNGMMRFNSKGLFNVPFCKKPKRFSKAYVTKISNQVKNISSIIKLKDYSFIVCDFGELIKRASCDDIIYCDPPYIDRYSDYFNSWTQDDENRLFEVLNSTKAKFLLSTWHSNKYRKNIYIEKMWNAFFIDTQSHFYHLGANEKNRNPMTEALVSNFEPPEMKKHFDLQSDGVKQGFLNI
jgi:DNA adenine methylase